MLRRAFLVGALATLAALHCEGADIVIGVDRKPLVDAGEGGLIPPPRCPPCSDDLHSVVDCQGNIKLVCPPEQACSPSGDCVAPCEGAARSPTNLGCDFMLIEPDVLQSNWQGACHALLVASAWEEPLELSLEHDGKTVDAGLYAYLPLRQFAGPTRYEPLTDGKLFPREMAVILLGGASTSCGYFAAFASRDLAVHGTGRGHAVRLRTTRPVAAYDIYPWTPTPSAANLPAVPSATLLLPVSAWGSSALGITGWPITQGADGGLNAFWSGLVITSAVATTLTIFPSVHVAGAPGVPSIPKNAARSVTLGAGETLQLEQFEDLSGARLRASANDKIAVWGTHQCMSIPLGSAACDAAHQQLPPVSALGSEHVAVRYASRPGSIAGEESVPWRIVSVADNTLLTYDPPIAGPLVMRAGQTRVFDSAGAFIVKSQDGQHPFYMSAQMTGYGALSDSFEGDPESVNIVPVEQWMTSYRFAVDPTYRNVSLVVVRSRARGDADVVLDCAGALGGWTPIGGEGKYDYTRVDLVRSSTGVASCDFGSHLITSAARFSATLWATDAAVSHAYPIGARVAPINNVDFTNLTP